MAEDLVCGMEVDERQASFTSTYEGRTYYFCSRQCQMEFDQDPHRYVGELSEIEIERPNFQSPSTAPGRQREDMGPLR